MKEGQLPSNVKQIGTIGEGPRIYLEECVHSYLNACASSAKDTEKIALLLGKHLIIDGEKYIFICGAIEGIDCAFVDGIETFTQKSFHYAKQQMKQFFQEYKVMGFMQSQPGYGTYLNPFYAEYHMNTFTEPEDLLFVIDPMDKSASFYRWNEDQTAVIECGGYFICDDQNAAMTRFMKEVPLENPTTHDAKNTVTTRVTTATTPHESAPLRLPITKKASPYTQERFKPKPLQPSSTPAPIETPRFLHPKPQRFASVMMSFSAVLFVLSCILGVGLFQGLERIVALEENIVIMNTAYNYLSNELNQMSAQAVFAPDSNQLADGGDVMEDPEAPSSAGPLEAQDANTEPTTSATEPTTQAPSDTTTADTTPTETTTPTPTESVTQAVTEATTSEAAPAPTEAMSATAPATTSAAAATEPVTQVNASLSLIPSEYSVQEGDSLLSISLMFYGSDEYVESIMQLNDIIDPDTIYFGKVLKLPQQ